MGIGQPRFPLHLGGSGVEEMCPSRLVRKGRFRMSSNRAAGPARRLSRQAVWTLTLLTFAVSRLSIVPTVLDFRTDELLYASWAQDIASGRFPISDESYQYPPGAGLYFLLLDVMPGGFHRFFTLSVLLGDVIILGLLLWHVHRRGSSWLGPWSWIVGGALAGGLLYERFDVIPAVFAVMALLVVSRPVTSGLLTGVGTAIKVWPVFMLFAVPRKNLARASIGAVAALVVVAVAAALVAEDSLSFLFGQTGRGLQIESSLAVPLMLAGQMGLLTVTSVDRYGSNELESPLAGVVSWIGIGIAVLLLLAILIQRLRGYLESLPPADVALAALLVFWAFNRVNSSQFFIWVAAVAAVALLDRRSRMLVPIVLAFLSMLPIDEFLGPYFWALQGLTLEAVLLQTVRVVLIVFSALIAWWLVVVSPARGSTASTEFVD